jgi:hypothetical protein
MTKTVRLPSIHRWMCHSNIGYSFTTTNGMFIFPGKIQFPKCLVLILIFSRSLRLPHLWLRELCVCDVDCKRYKSVCIVLSGQRWMAPSTTSHRVGGVLFVWFKLKIIPARRSKKRRRKVWKVYLSFFFCSLGVGARAVRPLRIFRKRMGEEEKMGARAIWKKKGETMFRRV